MTNQLPHNIDAEQALLGSILISQDAMLDVIKLLEPKDFFIGRNQLVYQSMQRLFDAKVAIDIMTVGNDIDTQGKSRDIEGGAYLVDLLNIVPTSVNALHYANIVKQQSVKRQTIQAAAKVTQQAYEFDGDVADLVNDVQAEFLEISGAIRKDTDLRPVKVGLNELIDRIEYVQAHPDELRGLPTGLGSLDKILGGLRGGAMVTLAARPGMGKSSLACNIALNVAQQEKRVAFFSLEMSIEEVSQRFVCDISGINSHTFNTCQFKDDEYLRLMPAVAAVEQLPIMIDDTSGISPQEIRAKVRKQAAISGLDLIIVDYMQLMTAGKGGNRQEEVSFISAQMKNLARELDVPILALAQLNRSVESRSDKRPMLADLRESGAIEQDSDVVIFLYRDEVYDPDSPDSGMAELIVAKHRQGPTGITRAFYQKEIMKFQPLAIRTDPLDY